VAGVTPQPQLPSQPHSTATSPCRYSFPIPQMVGGWVGLSSWWVSELEFNVPFQHKCGYIRDDFTAGKIARWYTCEWSLILVLTERNVEQLRWCYQCHYHSAKTPFNYWLAAHTHVHSRMTWTWQYTDLSVQAEEVRQPWATPWSNCRSTTSRDPRGWSSHRDIHMRQSSASPETRRTLGHWRTLVQCLLVRNTR